MPLLLIILSFTTLLSYEMDDRYTWLLTFVLSMLVFWGGDFFVRCLKMILGRSVDQSG